MSIARAWQGHNRAPPSSSGPPSVTEWLLLATVGLAAAVPTYCDVRSCAVGEASFIAPFFYTRIVFISATG